MKIQPAQLSSQISKQVQPIFLMSGDEILLLEETCDIIRKYCKHQGYSEREVFHLDANNKPWDDMLASANSMSLFSDKKLIEIRCKTNKIGDRGSKAINAYLSNINPDCIILIIMPKLDSAQNKSKWVKAIEAHGIHCQHWPIERHQLPQFISQRLQQHGLKADSEAINFLADNVEGNLLAAKQEIEKLALLVDDTVIDLPKMIKLSSNSSRYTVFNYVDRCLQGDKKAALNTLQGLKSEGCETTLVLWAISRELRTLYRLAKAQQEGMNINAAMRNERIFESRKSIIEMACQRLSTHRIERSLRQLRQVDQSIKGIKDFSPWIQLEQLTLRLC